MTLPLTTRGTVNGTQTRQEVFVPSVVALKHQIVLALQYDQTKTAIETNRIYTLTTPNQTGVDFGFNSEMYVTHLAIWNLVKSAVRILAIPLAEPTTGTPAASTGNIITITGTATASGNLVFYVHGRKFSVAIPNTTTADSAGALVAAEINAATDILLGSSTNTSGVVAATATYKGTTGDKIRVTGARSTDDQVPAGLAVSFASPSNGAGDETEGLNASGGVIDTFVADGDWKTAIITAANSQTAMDLLTAMIGLPEDGTSKGSNLWADDDYRPAAAYFATTDNLSTAKGFTSARKSDPNTHVFASPDSPEMPFVIAACGAVMEAMSCNSNAATKHEGLSLFPSVSPAVSAANDWTSGSAGKANIMDALTSGLSVIKNDADGNKVLHDCVSTYRPDGYEFPVWQYTINKIGKTWNIGKTLRDDKLTFKDDVIVEVKSEASDQPLAVDADTMKARVVSLAEGWAKLGWIFSKRFTIANMKIKTNVGGDPDRFDRYIPVLLSGNRRVTSDTVLIDRNTAIAGVTVDVG